MQWGRKHLQWLAVGAAVASVAGTALPTSQSDLPNLRPAAPHQVQLSGDGGLIHFATTTFNVGSDHLDILGTPTDDRDVATASQCIAFVDRLCTDRIEVGTFDYHEPHDHYHLDDYALYSLREVLDDGTPDFSDAGLIAVADKVSFCLLDGDRTTPAADTREGVGYYQLCETNLQGISVGWGDTYEWDTPGQEIELDGRRRGLLAIVIEVNPSRNILESDHEDNVAWTVVRLRGGSVDVVSTREDIPDSIPVRRAQWHRSDR